MWYVFSNLQLHLAHYVQKKVFINEMQFLEFFGIMK